MLILMPLGSCGLDVVCDMGLKRLVSGGLADATLPKLGVRGRRAQQMLIMKSPVLGSRLFLFRDVCRLLRDPLRVFVDICRLLGVISVYLPSPRRVPPSGLGCLP